MKYESGRIEQMYMNKQFGRIMEQQQIGREFIMVFYHGKIVVPTGLAGKLIKEAHGPAHSSRGKTAKNLENWWPPFLYHMVSDCIKQCQVCQQFNPKKGHTSVTGRFLTPTGAREKVSIDLPEWAG